MSSLPTLEFVNFAPALTHPWYSNVEYLIGCDILGQSPEVAAARPLPKGDYYALSQDDNLVALGTLDFNVFSSGCHLKYLAVAREYRRQGYGREMLQRLEQIATNAGSKAIYLFTNPCAAKFYAAQGYESDPSLKHRMQKNLRGLSIE